MQLVRIAITGTSGVGKTTLAKALAEKYQVPYIPEDWNGLFAALKAFKTEKNPDRQKEQLQRFVQELNQWLKYRRQLCNDNQGFVMDRCVFDAFKMVIHEHVFSKETEAIKKLIQQSINFSKSISCVVVPPLSQWMSQEPINQQGMKRNNDLHHKIYSQSLTIGLLEQFCHTKKIYLSAKVNTTEARINKVDEYLTNQK